MKRRQFNAWALASGAGVGLSACGGGGGSATGSEPLVLSPDGLVLQLDDIVSAAVLQPKLLQLADGSLVLQWPILEGSQRALRLGADGRRLGAEMSINGEIANALSDGGFRALSATYTGYAYTMLSDYNPDGELRATVTQASEWGTSWVGSLPNGEFFNASSPSVPSIYGEPGLPTAYSRTVLRRFSRDGQRLPPEMEFDGSRGQWFQVAPDGRGGFWVLRSVVHSFGWKVLGASAESVWLERYDSGNRLLASTQVATAPRPTDLYASPDARGVQLLPGPKDGTVLVRWREGQMYYGPSPIWNEYFRWFDEQAQPLGPASALFEAERESDRYLVAAASVKAGGEVDVYVVNRVDRVAEYSRRQLLPTGGFASPAEVLFTQASGYYFRRSDPVVQQSWPDGSAVLAYWDEIVAATSYTPGTYAQRMRRFASNGSPLRWLPEAR